MYCLWNTIHIGPSNNQIKTYMTGGLVALTTSTIPTGSYYFDTLRNELITQVRADNADFATSGKLRIGLSSTGFVTVSTSATTSIAVEWPDTDLRDLFGFTCNLSAATIYYAPRKINAAFYPSNPLTSFISASARSGETIQTVALSGKTRTTLFGVKQLKANYNQQFVNNMTELQSPAGSIGSSYLGTGITEYKHAEWNWYDSENQASQGWNDGRPVRFFNDASNAAIILIGSSQYASNYSEWIFDKSACEDWANVAKQMYQPKTTFFSLNAKLLESK